MHAAWRAALHAQPEFILRLYDRGVDAREVVEAEGGLQRYRDLVKYHSTSAEARASLAIVLQEHEEYAESLQEFRIAQVLALSDPDWRYPLDRWVERARDLDGGPGREMHPAGR